MELEHLKLLGLNTYEIKTYTTLLKKGKSKVSKIIEDSQVPSGKIYETLDSLETKGLVAIVPDKIKYYIPKSINNLKEIIKQKESELKQLNKELDEFKDIIEQRTDGEITVVRGKKNFHRLIKEFPEVDKFTYYIKWKADITDMNIMKGAKEKQKRNIVLKTLYDFEVPKENIAKWEKYTPNYDYIKTEGIAMHIDEKITMISILSQNSTILIKSKEFSEVMKQLYEGYYENQKNKIKQ